LSPKARNIFPTPSRRPLPAMKIRVRELVVPIVDVAHLGVVAVGQHTLK
jgi:hypothetical protein